MKNPLLYTTSRCQGLRTSFFVKIMDFDRWCEYTNRLSKEQLDIVFPWIADDDASTSGDQYSTLPSIEESLKRYEELMKKNG